jgi:ssDNA-binding Zn-finger/Zn-ribbon topoisomerase 1
MEVVVAIQPHCPLCGFDVRVRRNSKDGNEFVGCSGYPRCKWTGPADAALQNLSRRILKLEDEVFEANALLRKESAFVTASDIKAILAWAHPDKHPTGSVPAHDLAIMLTSLLARVSKNRGAR